MSQSSALAHAKRDNIVSLLPRSALFNQLAPSRLESLASKFSVSVYKEGGIIEPKRLTRQFYVIAEGQVEMIRSNRDTGREITVFFLNPGDAFDVVALLDGKEHNLSPRFATDATLLVAPIEAVRDWINQHPSFNRAFLPYLGQQMRKLEDLASDLALHDTVTRLSRLILAHATTNSLSELAIDPEMRLISNLTHDSFARMIGSVRAVVNRHMQIWKKQGILDLKRKKIIIKDLEALRKLSESPTQATYSI